MKLFIPAVAAGALTIATAFLIAQCSNDVATDAHATAATPVSKQAGEIAMRAEIQELRREVANLTAHLNAGQGRATAAVTHQNRIGSFVDAAQVAREMGRTDTAERAAAERALAEHVAGIATGFEQELRDERWSSVATTRLQTALAATQPRALALRSIECRSRTCRVEIEDSPPGSVSEAMPQLGLGLADVLPNIIVDRAGADAGRGTLVLYLSKS